MLRVLWSAFKCPPWATSVRVQLDELERCGRPCCPSFVPQGRQVGPLAIGVFLICPCPPKGTSTDTRSSPGKQGEVWECLHVTGALRIGDGPSHEAKSKCIAEILGVYSPCLESNQGTFRRVILISRGNALPAELPGAWIGQHQDCATAHWEMELGDLFVGLGGYFGLGRLSRRSCGWG